MRLNHWGEIAQSCWDEIPQHFPQVELDAFVVMPNHIHGIAVITVGAQYRETNLSAPLHPASSSKEATPQNVPAGSLGAIVRAFKAGVTRIIRREIDIPDQPIWQRNYHEHIIRHEASLNQFRHYIVNNPSKWAEDSLYSV